MTQLQLQKALTAASPRQRRRSDKGERGEGGREGESDDSYFSDSDFDDDEYSDVQHLDDDGMSQTSDFTSYSDETMVSSMFLFMQHTLLYNVLSLTVLTCLFLFCILLNLTQ